MNKTGETTVVCFLGALVSEQSTSQSVSQLVLFSTTDLYQVDPWVLITMSKKVKMKQRTCHISLVEIRAVVGVIFRVNPFKGSGVVISVMSSPIQKNVLLNTRIDHHPSNTFLLLISIHTCVVSFPAPDTW